MTEPRVAAVTIAHGRHDHLEGLLDGLRRSERRPDLTVVAAMDDPAVARLVGTRATVVEVSRVGGRLPLAAARNTAARAALDDGADLLVFLDVDCIPSPRLVGRYAAAARDTHTGRPTVLGGAVHYLPPRTAGRHYAAAELDASVPHPARPALPDGEVGEADDVRLFWSLSFAMTAPDWRELGGFDEGYTGYGGEDTDFAMRLQSAGGRLLWVGGAVAYHQHHAVANPPVDHLADIVRNANRFWDRWGWSPMGGWLDAFEADGLVTRAGTPPRWVRTGAGGSAVRTG